MHAVIFLEKIKTARKKIRFDSTLNIVDTYIQMFENMRIYICPIYSYLCADEYTLI